MSEGSDVATAGRPVGVFQRFGEFVVRRPLVVIALWIAVAAALTATLPTLQQMVRERPVDLLPADAPVMQTTRQMTASFDETGSQNIMLVVLTDEDGLTHDDEQVYRTLVDTLRRESADVTSVQDFLATPPLRDVLASKDGKAWYVPVVLAGELGTPRGYDAYTHVAGVVKAATADAALTTNLTGPAATVADLTDVGERDLHQIEIATAVMVLLILLLVYRNPVTMTLPLATIGLSLLIAQDMVAGLAKLGLGISNQTITFMTAMMVGAGVDYAVFLISRYHEYLRSGIDSDRAVVRALESIGKVIAASAATVAVTFLGMSFTRLGLFATTGPALALSIAVAFLAAVTLLPALLVLTGRRGWIKPRRDLTTRFWRRSGINTVRRPTPGSSPACWCCSSWRAAPACCASTTTTARPCPPTPRAISATPRWTGISHSTRPSRNTSTSSRRTICGPPRRWPISNRWLSASVSCRTSKRCAASPGRPVNRWNRPA